MPVKEEIVELLKSVNREGMENLVKYLEESDFFVAPASTIYHSNSVGGLAQHSLNVYKLLDEKVKRYYPDGSISDQSIKICALLHDAAKINTYHEDFKWVKDENNKWMQEKCWKVRDELPLGHGSKSVFIIQQYLQLTDQEIAAILYHMGMSEIGTHLGSLSYSYKAAMVMYPLVSIIHTADLEATFILESEKKEVPNLSTP